ncbi:flagellin N-terminal helical domain-containing protein [Virgibacillus senegalensis]|uniref:flagellin N-terminal helical domain-containing protein n=1 Tax=Virgibacillus senegalensis TaxID=1499679 RepID=UPI0004247247|nr:flagellin [Virgibacillus senegalensis]
MRINHNIAALNTHRQLAGNQSATQNSLEKLSSGLRINKAGDDAAGLAISEKMRGQIRGLDQAQNNAQDGISLIQTAEGAMNETHSILQRMRELAVQSSNDTNTDADRAELQKEVNQLSEELTRIADDTEFNTQKLLDGNFEGKFHIGANKDQNISLSINAVDAETLKVGEELDVANATSGDYSGQSVLQDASGNTVAVFVDDAYYSTSDVTGTAASGNLAAATDAVAYVDSAALASGDTAYRGIDISSQSGANSAIDTVNDAIETVSAERSKLGAYQNRLEHTINNLGTSSENLTAAESRIRDVDMAKEMMAFTKNNILSQAAQSMLAQANQQPQGVLQLLQ